VKLQAFRSAMILACALFFSACAMFHPRIGRDALVGTWTNILGTVWMLKSDGTFEVDLDHNGQRDAWGKYTVSGDTITLLRVGGIRPRQCDGKGVYRFTRTNDALQFTLVSDDCKLRRKNVLLRWTLK
jgi:hypothetical protein